MAKKKGKKKPQITGSGNKLAALNAETPHAHNPEKPGTHNPEKPKPH